jgi:hypothetical protein
VCLVGELVAYVKCETRAEKCFAELGAVGSSDRAGFGFARIKRLRAFGGCLGTERR